MASDGNGDLTRRSVFQLTGVAFALPALQSSYVENGPMPFTPKFVDLVRNVTSVTGTGPVTLGQAVNGYTSLAAAVSPDEQFYYCIQSIDKPQEREVGRGTMQSDGKVARQPVFGPATNFTTGTKTIALVAAAEWFSKLDQLGGGMGVAANRAELAVRDGANAGHAFLAEAGRAGSFVFDPANHGAKVSADPAQGLYLAPASDPSGASGAWVRRFDGAVNVKWFGATGDGVTNDGAAFVAAIACLKSIAVNDDGIYKGSTRLYVPPGHYFLGATTLDITHTLLIEGDGTSNGANSTKLRWAANTTGIRVQYYNTSGAGDVGVAHHSGASAAIKGLWLVGGFAGWGATPEGEYHGIHAKAAVAIDDVRIEGFQGDGIHVRASAGAGAPYEGNANVMCVRRCRIGTCRNGIYLDGADSNGGYFEACNLNHNRQAGIWDSSFLGNTHVAHHTAGNGQSLAGITPTMVSHGGNRYFPKFDQVANAKVNAPSGTTADTDYWYYFAPGGVDLDRSIPAWSNGMELRVGGAYLGDNFNAASVFIGCYSEQDQAGSQIISPSLVLGGAHGAPVKGFMNIRAALGHIELDFLQANYDAHLLGSANQIGPWAGSSTPNVVYFNNTATSNKLCFRSWISGSPQTDAEIHGANGFGLLLDGYPNVELRPGGNYAGHMSPTGFNLAAGRVIKINNIQVVGAQGAALPANATDLASAIALINAMKARMVAHGLVAA